MVASRNNFTIAQLYIQFIWLYQISHLIRHECYSLSASWPLSLPAYSQLQFKYSKKIIETENGFDFGKESQRPV